MAKIAPRHRGARQGISRTRNLLETLTMAGFSPDPRTIPALPPFGRKVPQPVPGMDPKGGATLALLLAGDSTWGADDEELLQA